MGDFVGFPLRKVLYVVVSMLLGRLVLHEEKLAVIFRSHLLLLRNQFSLLVLQNKGTDLDNTPALLLSFCLCPHFPSISKSLLDIISFEEWDIQLYKNVFSQECPFIFSTQMAYILFPQNQVL